MWLIFEFLSSKRKRTWVFLVDKKMYSYWLSSIILYHVVVLILKLHEKLIIEVVVSATNKDLIWMCYRFSLYHTWYIGIRWCWFLYLILREAKCFKSEKNHIIFLVYTTKVYKVYVQQINHIFFYVNWIFYIFK